MMWITLGLFFLSFAFWAVGAESTSIGLAAGISFLLWVVRGV